MGLIPHPNSSQLRAEAENLRLRSSAQTFFLRFEAFDMVAPNTRRAVLDKYRHC